MAVRCDPEHYPVSGEPAEPDSPRLGRRRSAVVIGSVLRTLLEQLDLEHAVQRLSTNSAIRSTGIVAVTRKWRLPAKITGSPMSQFGLADSKGNDCSRKPARLSGGGGI